MKDKLTRLASTITRREKKGRIVIAKDNEHVLKVVLAKESEAEPTLRYQGKARQMELPLGGKYR